MDLHLEGATRLHATREVVFYHLTDPRLLADTIPDKEEAPHIFDGSKVEAKLKVSVPPSEEAITVEMAVAEKEHPSKARLVAQCNAAGGTLKVVSSFELLGDSPTWVHWTADAEVKGTIAGLAPEQLRMLADQKAEEILGTVTKAVESTPRESLP